MKTSLILGATSAMARALAKRLASPERQLILAGPDPEEMEKDAADLAIRSGGPKPLVLNFDATDWEAHETFLARLGEKVRTLDEAYVFFGLMPLQEEAQKDFRLARDMFMVNYVGAVSILELIAAYMEARRQGLIVAVSSVAGDRGRQSNYLYGSSKAGLTVYLSGLRNRLAKAGVQVLTVKPGMVDTPMTRGMKKGILFVKPEVIAAGILKAVAKRKNIAYVPGYWRWIMWAIRSIPEPVFKRMKL